MTRDTILKWFAILVFLCVNIVISLAFVIARPESAEATNANLYKGASLILGLLVLWLALRQKRYVLLVAFSMLQLFAFGRFAEALNNGVFS